MAEKSTTALTDCFYFLKGKCRKGEECEFRHCPQAITASTQCADWPQCKNKLCPNLHPAPPRPIRNASAAPPIDDIHQQETVTTLWDLENVAIPRGHNAFDIVKRLRKRLIEDKNLREDSFKVYCDINNLHRKHQTNLNDANVRIIHVPNFKRESVDREIFLDMQKIITEVKRPATVVLISGDKDYIKFLSELRYKHKFTVISIFNPHVHSNLVQTAHIHYPWADFTPEQADTNLPKGNNWPKPVMHLTDQQQFKCPLCQYVLRSADARSHHQIKRKHWYDCGHPKCSIACLTAEALERHVEREHSKVDVCNRPFVCQMCSKTFSTEARRAQHEQDKHRGVESLASGSATSTTDLIVFDENINSQSMDCETESTLSNSDYQLCEDDYEYLTDFSDASQKSVNISFDPLISTSNNENENEKQEARLELDPPTNE